MNNVGTSTERDRVVVPILAFSMMLAALGTSIANVALPTLTDTFAAPLHQVQWVTGGYLASLAISAVVVGRLGDLFGLRRVYLAGLALFALAALLCGLATNLTGLIAARCLQGVGAAVMMTLTMALVRDVAPKARIGRAMGFLGMISALGTALGPSLGGLLLSAAGWRSIFLILVLLAVMSFGLAIAALPPTTRNTKVPLLDFRALASKGLCISLFANLLVATVMMATLVVGPFYLSYGLHLGIAQVGLVMSIGPIVSIVAGVPSGHASDAWGTQRALVVGLSIMGLGALGLAVLPSALGLVGYLIAIAVLTPGYQLFQAANATAVMTKHAGENSGTISGLLNLSRNMGLMLGASLMGSVFSAGMGDEGPRAASTIAIEAGMRQTFIVAFAMIALALGLAVLNSGLSEETV